MFQLQADKYGVKTSNVPTPVDSKNSAPNKQPREMSNDNKMVAPQTVLKVDMRIQALEVQVWRCLSLLQHMHTPAGMWPEQLLHLLWLQVKYVLAIMAIWRFQNLYKPELRWKSKMTYLFPNYDFFSTLATQKEPSFELWMITKVEMKKE